MEFKSMATQEKEGHITPFRCVLAGAPGSGKTSMLASLCNNGYKVYVLDFDFENIAGVKDRLTEDGKDNYIGIPMYAEYDEKNKQTKGETSFDKCKEVLDNLKDSGVLDDPKAVLVVDSLTNFGNATTISTLKTTSGGEVDTRRTVMLSWDIATFFLGKMLTYSKNCNFIIMAHAKDVEVEGKPTQTGLEFLSKGYSLQIPKFAGMPAIYHVEKIIKKDQPPEVRVVTQLSNKVNYIKNPYADIPPVCQPDNFLLNLINRHNTGVWSE